MFKNLDLHVKIGRESKSNSRTNMIDSTFGGEEWNTNSIDYEAGEVERAMEELDAAEYEEKEDSHQKQIELIEAKAKAGKKKPEGQTSFLDE